MYAENKSRQEMKGSQGPAASVHRNTGVCRLSNSFLLSCITQRMYIKGQEFKDKAIFLTDYKEQLETTLQNDDVFLGTLSQILTKPSGLSEDPLAYAKDKKDSMVENVCKSDRHYYSFDAVADEIKKQILKNADKGKGGGNGDRPSIYPSEAAKGSPEFTRTFIGAGSLGHSLHHYVPYPILKKEAEDLIENLKKQKVGLEQLGKEHAALPSAAKPEKERLQKKIAELQKTYNKNLYNYKKLSEKQEMLKKHGVEAAKSEVNAWKPDNLVYGAKSSDRIYDPGSHLDYEAGLILDAENPDPDHMVFALNNKTASRGTKKKDDSMYVRIRTETKERHMKTDLMEQIYNECHSVIAKAVPENKDFYTLIALMNGCISRFAHIETDKARFVPALINYSKILMMEEQPPVNKQKSIKLFVQEIDKISDRPYELVDLKIPPLKVYSKKTTVTLNHAEYAIVNTPGDGDCFFHAYLALSGDRRSIDDLRALLPAGNAARRPHVWVNEMDIYAFAQAAGIRIEMYTQIGTQIRPAGVYGSAGAVYYILHVNGNHFVALKPA